jgi:topoisomerase-4 subunit A
LFDADQQYYYLKRFQLEPSQKVQNMLGENSESRLIALTDVDYPRFEVVMGGNDSYREALVVDADEFIGVKSVKAKGKRLTTFEVSVIKELEPVRFNEPDPSGDDGSEETSEDVENDANAANQESSDEDVVSDDVIDQKKALDDLTGQMTLF